MSREAYAPLVLLLGGLLHTCLCTRLYAAQNCLHSRVVNVCRRRGNRIMTRGCANGVVLWDRWQLRRRNRRTVRMKHLRLTRFAHLKANSMKTNASAAHKHLIQNDSTTDTLDM